MREALRKEMANYEKRTPKSAEAHRRASARIPLGVASNYRAYDPYPLFVKEGSAGRITDIDGNDYVDHNLCFGSLMAGHNHPAISKAVDQALRMGSMFGMPYEMENELAEEICGRFPIEMLRFASTGTEATMHACRLARAATMRDRILKFEGAYHGLHDAVLISVKPKLDEYGEERTPIAVPAGLGVAKGSVDSVVVAGFNDLPSVERRFEEHPNEIAAIIIEPIMMNVGMCLPAPGFLQGLRDIASKYGALLIFDEVKTGGKLDWGGASAYFGVKPDVITLAKSIGGGLPLAVFGARKGVMELISRHEMFHGGTFNANCVSVFAGLATFREVLTRANYAAVTRLSTKLSEGYKEIISSVGLEAYVATAGANGALMLFPRKVRNYRDWMRIDSDLWRHYWFGMANRGIIAQPYWWDEQWTISVQHTDADIRSHLEAFRDLAPDLARAQAENKTEQVSASGA